MRRRFVSFCVLGILYCLVSTISCWGAGTEYSDSTRNLSGLTDDVTYSWDDYDFKMAVSGQNVHVVWRAYRTDGGRNRLNYRHSTDGGITFGPVQVLVASIDNGSFKSEWQGLAVDGDTVHLLYVTGWPSGVKYLRSTDNGVSFEAVKQIHSTGYSDYSGIHMVAANGVVTVAVASNNDNSPNNKDLACIYSNDNGATFTTTSVAHSDIGQPTPIWRFGLADMIRSGTNIYILYTVGDENWVTSQGHLYLVSSNDGGVTFNTRQRVNVASSNGNYYTNTTQDIHYSPNLATVGNNVYVTWVNTEVNNFDNGGSTYTLRFRRSTDKGLTLEAPVTLSPEPVTSSVLYGGQETITAVGNNVYVATSYAGGSGTYLWRSINSGGSFETQRKVSDGGWWPTLLPDPGNPAKLHLTNGYYVASTDAGATFKGMLTLQPSTLTGWWSPILVAGSDGTIHYAATRSRYDFSTTLDIYYRRLTAAPTAVGPSKALRLVHDSTLRSDNMQIAASPDINLTSAMTIEFWLRKIAGGEVPHYQIVASKTRAAGQGTFEIGLWNTGTGHIYTRLVTESAASQNYGDWLGSGIEAKDDVWNHIAVTYDANGGANNWKIYVDGELANYATLTTGNMVMDNMPLFLRGGTSGYLGTMEIADFRIWNRARSATEIMADMSRTLAGTESGLVAYYTFNDTTRDMTGRNNDGVLMYKESFVASTVPTVTIVPLATAINNAALTVTTGATGTGGINGWNGRIVVTHDGASAAQSGRIPDPGTSWMQTTVTGPGQLSFWWKVSSQATYDFLRFKVDDVEQAAVPGISGEVDWTQVTIDIPSGSHTLQWVYVKNGGVGDQGQDAGWVDQVIYARTPRLLTLNFAVGGGGQVHGDLTCTSGTTCNPMLFPEGSNLVLYATPDTNSTFGSWSGCTSTSGTTCNVTLNMAKTVTATFLAVPPIKILGDNLNSFTTLRSAYNASALPPASSTIQIRSIALPDTLFIFDRAVNVIVKGGYDTSFSPSSNFTTIQGPVKIKDGRVVIEKLAVK